MSFLKKVLFLAFMMVAVSINNFSVKASEKITSTKASTTAASTKSSANIGIVTVSSLAVRSGPDTKYSIIGGLRTNEKVSIISLNAGWYKINFRNSIGYVSQSYVKTDHIIPQQSAVQHSSNTSYYSTNVLEKKLGYVSASALNVRNGPGTTYNVVKVLYRGEEVRILETQKDWMKISQNNSTGWVSAEFITLFKPQGGKNIVIDPGHGGFDPGSVGPTGVKEKNITLAVSLMLGDILESQGHNVVYTRKNDSITWATNEKDDVRARVDISNKAKADLFISIHTNASEYSSVRGIETYYSSANSKNKLLAKSIQDNMVKSMNLTNRGIREEKFYVIKNNQAVSALVELAYISNSTEEKLLNNSWNQKKWAEGIAKGINDYLHDN
ncbi:N-acetylmuramoyl-L-alanine amidase [Clostridium thermarum]|uniref:N-acetylmuramoyl-L-alanine amidase n=1 Tax=Clostridium thermarum TaxID=1716543 RepID=UPI0013D0B361|nr:N-acetylmuramoyl-L-alanine amidase [Clostridium thermarum]